MTDLEIRPLRADDIPAAWEWLGPMLEPAVSVDRDAKDVRKLLEDGRYEAAIVTVPEGRGVVVSELCTIDGVECLWLNYIAGQSFTGPKGFIAAVRKIMAEYENMARRAGCTEIRVGGRDWSRVFPDFERFDDMPNRLRKRL